MSGLPSTDPNVFRRLMGRWPTGVAIVTTRDGTTDYGLTVNGLLSVSLHPPSLLVSLGDDADTCPVVAKSRVFVANFLSAQQRSISERFALSLASEEKFRDLPLHRGVTGAAILDGSLGALECRVVSEFHVSDHRLFAGEVVAQELGVEAAPLVFHRSRYTEL
ncbi:MAG TPA: flavin reductase family protein [Thermoplasmata archaeon]|nr:flavin reductase family protein [Thermoplasmata archaeon]